MENKKCEECGVDFFAIGIGSTCPKCIGKYYEEREKKYPYVVYYGSDFEEFETEKEAEIFLDELRSAYVEKR